MTDYSSKAIDHRLKQVSEGRCLGVSLSRAGERVRQVADPAGDHEQQTLPSFPRPKRAAGPRKINSPKPFRGEIARLKVTLQNVRPAIWRRLEVPTQLSFGSLHDILQIAFGWTDSHLHEFHDGITRVGTFTDGDDDQNEMHARLDQIFRMRDRFIYEYDLADSWEHLIVLERFEPRDEGVAYPRCIGGKRSGPPEDCGGPMGYRRFLKVIGDPDHQEHESMREWSGDDFEAERFSIDEINRRLRQLSAARRWRPS